jgi:hypothetical protein
MILFEAFAGIVYAQQEAPIKFGYQYVNKKDADNVQLKLENVSTEKVFYYVIGVQGLTDTGYVGLVADINSLGKNDFLAIKPLLPKSSVTKSVSKRRMYYLYNQKNIKKLRFEVTYYEKRDFDSKSQIIYLHPL